MTRARLVPLLVFACGCLHVETRLRRDDAVHTTSSVIELPTKVELTCALDGGALVATATLADLCADEVSTSTVTTEVWDATVPQAHWWLAGVGAALLVGGTAGAAIAAGGQDGVARLPTPAEERTRDTLRLVAGNSLGVLGLGVGMLVVELVNLVTAGRHTRVSLPVVRTRRDGARVCARRPAGEVPVSLVAGHVVLTATADASGTATFTSAQLEQFVGDAWTEWQLPATPPVRALVAGQRAGLGATVQRHLDSKFEGLLAERERERARADAEAADQLLAEATAARAQPSEALAKLAGCLRLVPGHEGCRLLLATASEEEARRLNDAALRHLDAQQTGEAWDEVRRCLALGAAGEVCRALVARIDAAAASARPRELKDARASLGKDGLVVSFSLVGADGASLRADGRLLVLVGFARDGTAAEQVPVARFDVKPADFTAGATGAQTWRNAIPLSTLYGQFALGPVAFEQAEGQDVAFAELRFTDSTGTTVSARSSFGGSR